MSTATLASRVREHHAGSCRVLTLHAPVQDVVTWRASIVTNPDLAAGDDTVQELAVALLDKGTRHRDQFEIARIAEDRGASLDVNGDGLYVDLKGRSLVDDFADMVTLGAEMMREPAFDPEELEKTRAQMIGDLQRDMDQTDSQAAGALSRRLYGSGHPNYSATPESTIAELEALTVDDVRAYHERHFGATEMTFVAVGDVDHAAIARAVDDAVGDWAPHDAPATYEVDADPEAPGRVEVPMPDKSNVDVRMGHAVPLRRDDDAYLAAYVANYILGGDFSARLMNEVRDERGLTYHIGSTFRGLTTKYSGYWALDVALSHENLEEGIDVSRAVVRRFVEEGVTEDELEGKKTTLTGSFQVGLDTTRKLANTLLINAERGFDVGYLDRFPDLVNALTLDEVNATIRRVFRPDDLHVALAGTRPEVAVDVADA